MARRAVAYLRRQQNRDGGFGQMDGRESNSQSTSYAVQGLAAVHAAPGAVARALTYIRRRQRGDGSVAYSASSTQTPVWVTAQALMALRRAPLPVASVPRAPKPKPAADAFRGCREAQGGRQEGGGRRRTGAPRGRRPRDAPAAGGSDAPGSGQAGAETSSERREAHRPGGRPRGRGPEGGSDDGGGVPPWLMVLAATAVLAALVPFRRRLLRLARRPSTD